MQNAIIIAEMPYNVKIGTLIAVLDGFDGGFVLRAVRNRCQMLPVDDLYAVKSIVKVATVFPIIPLPGLINTENACERAIPPESFKPLESPFMIAPSVMGSENIVVITFPCGVITDESSMKSSIRACGFKRILRPARFCSVKAAMHDNRIRMMFSVIIMAQPVTTRSAINEVDGFSLSCSIKL